MSVECQYCGKEFSSTYYRNVHESEDCSQNTTSGYDEAKTYEETHDYGR